MASTASPTWLRFKDAMRRHPTAIIGAVVMFAPDILEALAVTGDSPKWLKVLSKLAGFFVALATLFVLIAPDAFGGPLRFDWWPVHVGLVSVASLGFVATLVDAAVTATGFDLPLSAVFGIDRAPGLWITLIALGVWISGVAQIVDARDDR